MLPGMLSHRVSVLLLFAFLLALSISIAAFAETAANLRARIDAIDKKSDDATSHLDSYMKIYEQRIQEATTNLNTRITESNLHTDKAIESFRWILTFGTILIGSVAALLTWIGFTTISKWIRQSVQDRVSELVTVESVSSLVLAKSGPVVDQMLLGFEQRAQEKFAQIEEQQVIIKKFSENIGTRLTPADTAQLSTASGAADAKSPDIRTASDWQTIALNALSSGEMDTAYDSIKRALALGMTDNRLNIAGLIANRLKKPEEAEAYFRLALDLSPLNPRALSNLANVIKTHRKDYDAAESLLVRAIAVTPPYDFAFTSFGDFLTEVRKDNDRAETMFRRAVEVAPTDAFSITKLARFLDEVRSDVNQAETLYRRVLASEPKHTSVLFWFGGLMEKTGRFPEAEAAYRQLLAVEPTNTFVRQRLERILGEGKKTSNG